MDNIKVNKKPAEAGLVCLTKLGLIKMQQV
jgi:hypothetical protein